MATANSTRNRIAVDLVEPFGVELNGVLLAEHPTLQMAHEFADVLRAGLNARTSNSANLDAADLAGLRLKQAAGVLNSIWNSGALDHLPSEEDRDAVMAAQELLEQGRAAVSSISFQED